MSLFAMWQREWRLALHRLAELVQPVLLFLMLVTLFALGTSPGSGLLQAFAPAMIWLAVVMSALIGAERGYRDEFVDGAVELLRLSPVPLSWLMAVKLVVHWLFTGLPLTLIAVPAAIALGMPEGGLATLLLSLLLGSPVITAIAGFVACLTASLPRAGLLLPLLVLPMMSPVVIFGAGAVRASLSGLPASAPLYFLSALLLLSLCLAPWGMAAALRNASE